MPESTDEEARAQTLPADLVALVAFYLAHGCPCRFPRFRSTCARDTGAAGAAGYTTFEQQALIEQFDAQVPLAARQRTRRGFQSKCSVCGAKVERWSEEQVRDVFFEYLRITPAKEIRDVGADATAPLPRCRDFYRAGVDDARASDVLGATFPKIAIDEWLTWMRALRGEAR